MANPQPDIFTKYSKEYHQAICKIRIPGEARQVLDFIMYKTWGFSKKEDWISLSQFEKGTGLKKPNVIRAVNKLLSMNLIIKKDNGIIKKDNVWGATYSLQKDYEKWKPLSKKITLSKKIKPVIKKDKRSLSKKIPTIDKHTKDNITKDTSYSQVVKYWFEKFKAKTGEVYIFDKKDGAIVKRLLKSWDYETFCKKIDLFFENEWINKEKAFSIAMLSSQKNRLIKKRDTKNEGRYNKLSKTVSVSE